LFFFENRGGVIEIWSASPRITNSLFINSNGSSIELTESDTWIEKNIFSQRKSQSKFVFWPAILKSLGFVPLAHGYQQAAYNHSPACYYNLY